MGKKKKAGDSNQVLKPFCYFCDKEFADEGVLIQHQASKHFRCTECKGSTGQVWAHGSRSAQGQCDTLHGLICHMGKSHKMELLKVPNAIEGRDDPAEGSLIYGMNAVPEEILEERYRKMGIAMPESAPPPMPSAIDLPPLPAEPSTSSYGLPPMPLQNQQNQLDAPSAGSQDWAQAAVEFAAKKAKEEQARAKEEMQLAQPVAAPSDFAAIERHSAPTAPLPDWLSDLGPPSSAGRPEPAAPQYLPSDVPSRLRAHGQRRPDVAAAFLDPRAASRSRSKGRLAPHSQGKRSRSPRSGSHGRRGQRSRSRRGHGGRDDGGRDDNRGRAGRRSSSRDRNRVEPPPFRQKPPDARELRTIHITGGLSERTTRLWLKKQMEMFGPVEICHSGNRHSANAEMPWVRFAAVRSAEAAMEAVKTGTLIIDSTIIQAEVGDGSRRAPAPPRDQPQRRSERDMQLTSRDLAMNDRRRDYYR